MAQPTLPEVLPAERALRPSYGGRGPEGGDGGEGGDDGDGGDGGDGGEEPRRDDLRFRKAKLAMVFVLFSLSVLFVVTLLVALLLRRSATEWNPGVAPAFPPTLWANTVVLVASSVTLRRAVRGIAEGRTRALTHGLGVTTALGTGFLVGQASAWHDLLAAGVTMAGPYGTVFYWLTGLHAAHVVGGVFFLVVCHVRALLGRYTRESHLGVELCEIYWHFLGVVWLVLVALLFALL
jgi:cytochrome c oxidase subunit III